MTPQDWVVVVLLVALVLEAMYAAVLRSFLIDANRRCSALATLLEQP